MTAGTTELVAAFVAGFPDERIPPEARRMASFTLADTFATAVAGTRERAAEVIRQTVCEQARLGSSRLIGADETVVPADAALANATAAHALDFDSISVAVSGFIGSATGCALAAWADAYGPYSGSEIVTAYCLGWEAAAAIARGVNIYHYTRGWHPTATLSHFSAALACARLAGLDVDATRMVVGVATSEASGVKTMIGNMLNPYHVGKAARNGVNAVTFVQNGFEAHPSALESEQGFLNVFNGREHVRPEAITSKLGQRWDLVTPGPIFKIYPCCGLIHSGIDATLRLRDEHGLEPARIRSILVRVHEYVPRVMAIDVPRHGYEAKFSISYCIAAAIHEGKVDLSTFDTVDPDVVALSRKVTVEVHPELYGEETFLANEFTDVEIRTETERVRAKVKRMANRGTGVNFTPEQIRVKLADCLRHGRSAADPDAEWGRLVQGDSDQPWSFWATA